MSERDDFRALLFDLGERGRIVDEIPDARVDRISTALSNSSFAMTRIDPYAVDGMLKGTSKLSLVPRQYIQLPAIEAGDQSMLPRVSLDVDFTVDPVVLQINVMSFLVNDGNLRAVSVRFEPPEGSGGGQHDYYHAQFTPAIGRNMLVPGFPAWFPDSKLSFPIDACNPVEALIAAIVHLYTAKEIHRMKSGSTKIWEYAQQMLLGRYLKKPDTK